MVLEVGHELNGGGPRVGDETPMDLRAGVKCEGGVGVGVFARDGLVPEARRSWS